MSEPMDQSLLKTAELIAQTVASATGVDLSSLHHVGRRTPEHIAEVARLGSEHGAMLTAMDIYSDSRSIGYGEKSNELFVDSQPQLPEPTQNSLSLADTKSE